MKYLALFPGQGSQQVGMGKDFYENMPEAKRLFDIADDVLGFSLSKLCFDGPIEDLTATEVVQPAILTVSTICRLAYLEKHASEGEMVAAAGHSLGEYTALVAAGAIAFEDAVALVNKRGRYMQEAVPRGHGKMVAVLGKEQSDVEAALKGIDKAQIANLNAPGQIVVSGLKEAVDEFLAALGQAKTVELTVSAPFHSALMKPAADRLAVDLDNLTIKDATCPVYCNVRATPVTKAEDIRQALKDQVCGSVRWVECMQNAIKDTTPDKAIEFGAGSVLNNLLKRIDKGMEREAVTAYAA